MQQDEMVALIRDGVPAETGIWADLGAGSGNFTAALRDLLPPTATIYAVDRDRSAIAAQQTRWQRAPHGATVKPLVLDITSELPLPPLDGILIANVLHFIPKQTELLRHLARSLQPGGCLLVVEYDLAVPRSYVPFPLSSAKFPALASSAGFAKPQIIGRRRSPSSGTVMYAAVAEWLEADQ